MKKSVRILLIVSCVILLVCNVSMLKKLKDEKNNTKAVDNIINDKIVTVIKAVMVIKTVMITRIIMTIKAIQERYRR